MEYRAEAHREASGKWNAQVWAHKDGINYGCEAFHSPFDTERAAMYAARSIALQLPARLAIPIYPATKPPFLWINGTVIP